MSASITFKTMICNRLTNSTPFSKFAYANSNRITYSTLSNFTLEGYNAPTYSIKYVLAGSERYFFNKKKYVVNSGHFLLVNKDQLCDTQVLKRQRAAGLCIHLKKDLLQQVFTDMAMTEEKKLENFNVFLSAPNLEELIYKDDENDLGKFLKGMLGLFDAKTATISFNEQELFLNLAQRLLSVQNTFATTNRLNVAKSTTRKELLHRLALAKEMMDDWREASLNIDTVAKGAMLSTAHLFRTFKQVYGLSPYQYLLKKKLDKAASLLSAKKHTVTEIAYEAGFADLASFSKAFKKMYGRSPNRFLTH